MKSTRKIAIINQKGGSGKTTTSVNLAAALAEKRRNVLLIDLDAQGSSTKWFGFDMHTEGVYPLFVRDVPIEELIVSTSVDHVDMVCSSTWLVGLDKRLAQELGAETLLKQSLEKLTKKYDYILIDCPPTLGILTINALAATHEIIVPVEARFMALNGLVDLLQTIDVIKKRLNPGLRVAGIVPCRVDGRTKHAHEVVEALTTNFKGMLYKSAIRENIRLSEAPSFNKPIMLYDKRSNGTIDYRSLAKEVMKQESK